MKIVATYTDSVQVGVDAYRDRHISKAFLVEESFLDIFKWAESIGIKDPKLSDFLLSELLD